MSKTLEVLLNARRVHGGASRDLSRTTVWCWTFCGRDTSMTTALAMGGKRSFQWEKIRRLRSNEHGRVLLAGNERLRMAAICDGLVFDLGISPREFTSDRVRGGPLS